MLIIYKDKRKLNVNGIIDRLLKVRGLKLGILE